MPEPTIEPMHELRIWVRESDYRALKVKAETDGASKSEIVRRALAKHLGEEAASETAPWLADMLDAILSRYFQGFPETLQRLVWATYEAHSWQSSSFVKLLELCGDKSIESQNQRVAKTSADIGEYADRKAAEFFQSLAAPEELIEPSEPTAE